ncbi:MAG TPA: hypothetical protein VKT77_21445 [Chthonomonadaceae bacterium]|nr:hypothetical protein [Chthonomonadaceae bacterium]
MRHIRAAHSVVCAFVAFALAANPARAQHEDQLGLSCDKILAMKPEKWAELHNKRMPNGELGYDDAYRAYAHCWSRRNEGLLARLPRAESERIRKLASTCASFRIDNLELQQAYAGGGTMYTHAQARGTVDDAQLVERLARHYRKHQPTGHSRRSIAFRRVRARIAEMNPASPSNNKTLAQFSTGERARAAFSALRHEIDDVEKAMNTESYSMRDIVLKFMLASSRAFGG